MKLLMFIISLSVLLILPGSTFGQVYDGTQSCRGCHSVADVGGLQYPQWYNTLHAKTHLLPDTNSIKDAASFSRGDSITMGANFGNAYIYLSKNGAAYYAKVGASGNLYKIQWTYGAGYKQRFLVKIDTSYYMLPIQYNFNGYLDASSGAWVSVDAQNWFNSDGSLKSIDGNFRKTSWDKNCMGCHITGGKVAKIIHGTDTSWHASWGKNGTDYLVQNINVGCEECHGPSQGGGSAGHQMNPAKLPTKQAKMDVCGQCHSRSTSIPAAGMQPEHMYPMNEPNNIYYNPADLTKPLSMFLNLSQSPNTPGGPVMWPDNSTAANYPEQYQEMLSSKHWTNQFEEITCFTCHTAHGTNMGSHNLRDSLNVQGDNFAVAVDDNTLCLSCHAGHGSFTAIMKSWVHDPLTYNDSIGTVINHHTHHNLYDPKNEFATGGSGRCTNCHMAATATNAVPYDLHTHTFAVIPPIQTIRYASADAPTKGMLNSCAVSCHRNPGENVTIPTFGIGSDPNLTDWTEGTDIALADTLWRYWQRWGLTGVKEVEHALPIAYNLSQNYPNPFNPTTNIDVQIPKRDHVRLTIYNMLGQVVATLMDGDYEAGTYKVTWNGHNNFGLTVPTGVYLYRLDAGVYSKTNKMIMLK
ncbi:MAG: T9SS type A sorting domain-containing protein [Bacteroidota bacterium]